MFDSAGRQTQAWEANVVGGWSQQSMAADSRKIRYVPTDDAERAAARRARGHVQAEDQLRPHR